jgi:HEAT repeat protein
MLDSGLMQKHLEALQSGAEAARRQAVHWLRQQDNKDWETAPRPVLHALVEALRQELAGRAKQPANRQAYRQEVAAALGSLGPASRPAIPELLELLQDGVPDPVRAAAATALGKIGADGRGPASERIETALVAFWLAPGHAKHVHLSIASALVRLQIDAPGLIGFLTSTAVAGEEVALRTEAASALGWCAKQQPDVVPALLTVALTDKQEDVRHQAEASVSRLGLAREQAVLLCARQLGDSAYAETALRHSGELAIPGLRHALKTADVRTQEKALRTLGSLGELGAAAVPEVTRLLRDRDLDLRLAAAKSLWNITRKADGVVPVLVGLLESKRTTEANGDVRRRFLQTVIEALRRIGPPARAAIPALTRKTRDPNRLVSESATSALREINSTGANETAGR